MRHSSEDSWILELTSPLIHLNPNVVTFQVFREVYIFSQALLRNSVCFGIVLFGKRFSDMWEYVRNKCCLFL